MLSISRAHHPKALAGAAALASSVTPTRRRMDGLTGLADAPDEMLLAPSEVSALSGFAEETWRLWRRQGRGPVWLDVEGRPRLTMGAYRAWLATSR